MHWLKPLLAFLLCAGFSTAARSAEYEITPEQTVVGKVGLIIAKHEDTLLDLARDHSLGFVEMMAANPGVDPWLPGKGTKIILPMLHVLPEGPRKGIVINVAARRLFLFSQDGKNVTTYPIGVGQMGRNTPMGETKITRMSAAPTWYPPPSIRKEDPTLPAVVPPGPDNPLGSHALYLGWPRYLIHGTNKPYGIGRAVSHGCIQLYPEHITQLSDKASVGLKVRVIQQETAIVRLDDTLYAVAYPNRKQGEAIEVHKPFTPEVPRNLQTQAKSAIQNYGTEIDWAALDQAGLQRTGLLVPIGAIARNTARNED